MLLIKRHWKISLFVLLFLPVLISLGLWQLERAKEKQQEWLVYQQRQDLPAIPLTTLATSELKKYQNIELVGTYDTERYWLLDNQPRAGRSGYELVMPLFTEQGIALINRGWVEASPRREQLPSIETPTGSVTIKGYLYPSQENAIFNKSASDLALAWPKRVLQLKLGEAMRELSKNSENVNKAEAVLGKSFVLRIQRHSPGALVTDWPVINTRPEKHRGYAVQWFAMAFALVSLYVWLLYRTRREPI